MSEIPATVVQAQTEALAKELAALKAAARDLRKQLADFPALMAELRAVAGEEWDALMTLAERC